MRNIVTLLETFGKNSQLRDKAVQAKMIANQISDSEMGVALTEGDATHISHLMGNDRAYFATVIAPSNDDESDNNKEKVQNQ